MIEQLANERITLGEQGSFSAVLPGGGEETLRSVEGGRRSLPEEETSKLLLDSWHSSAISHAEFLKQRIQSVDGSSIAYSRLAHAQLAAGLFEDARDAAERTLEKAHQGYVNDIAESFDQPSATAALRVLAELGHSSRVEEWLDVLPSHSVLAKMRARLAIGRGKFDKAILLLDTIPDRDAASLRGYVYLEQGRPQAALRELRLAASFDPRDPAISLNMALAFWRLGSVKKSIRFARLASRIAPERKDASFVLLELLLVTGDYSALEAEISYIRSLGIVESADFLMLRARFEFERQRVPAGTTLMRRAVAEARKSENDEYVEFIQLNLDLKELASVNSPEAAIFSRIDKAIRRFPASIHLIEMYASYTDRVSHARALRGYIDTLLASHSEEDLYRLNHRLAFLEGRFDEAMTMADKWSNQEPLNSTPVSCGLMLRGQLVPDASQYESLALESARRFCQSDSMQNNLAFSLALCGRADAARKVLRNVTEWSFYLEATAGLVEVVSGNLDSGMRLYRRAAEMADKVEDGRVYRSLMTLYQAMALRQLGLLDCHERNLIVAQSLPPIDLPEDWEDRPAFLLLKVGAERRGWEWPPEIV